MDLEPLTIELIHLDGSAVLAVCGEIDMATAPQLRHAVQEAQAHGVPIVLDMAQVTFMDSSGLHVLLDEHLASGETPAHVQVRNPSKFVQQILHVAGAIHLLLVD